MTKKKNSQNTMLKELFIKIKLFLGICIDWTYSQILQK